MKLVLLCAQGLVGVRPAHGVCGRRMTNGLPRGAGSGAHGRISRSACHAGTSCGPGASTHSGRHVPRRVLVLNRWIVLFGRVPPLSCRAVGMVQFRPWPSWAGGPPPCPSPSPPAPRPCGGCGTVTGPVTLVLQPCPLIAGGTTCFRTPLPVWEDIHSFLKSACLLYFNMRL